MYPITVVSIIQGTFLTFVTILLTYTHCKKPHSSKQQAVWRIECELGLTVDPECPVDGGWSSWGPWSTCRGACDDVGERRRIRACVSPPPSYDGAPCRGSIEQIESCYVTNCSLNDFHAHLLGSPTRLDALRQLNSTPALAERCLRAECPYETVKTALISDDTGRLDTETLWNCLQCVKRNIGCPVGGEWGTWSSWSACSADCGHGTRWRLRRCDSPPPSAAHLSCHGLPLYAEFCEGDRCAVNHSRNSGISMWAPWGDWSVCSERCGPGVRRRKRVCKERERQHSYDLWSANCNGEHEQLEVCRVNLCVLEGGWSGWSAWGSCSQSCGAGRRTRTRSCTRPESAGGGAPCPGPHTEFGACYLFPCEVYTHLVAVFKGEGSLVFNFENKRSALFYTYIRFMPLSAHGILIRRGSANDQNGLFAQLSLHRWRLCAEASGPAKKCGMTRLCSTRVFDPETWHNAVFAVTGDGILVRIDDLDYIRGSFPCDPELHDEPFAVHVGEKYCGELQEIIVNFIPLNFKIERFNEFGYSFLPNSATNIAYEKGSIAEGYIILRDGQYVRLPCFYVQDEWFLKLTVKPQWHSGLLLYMLDIRNENSLSTYLQNNRFKMKLVRGDFRYEIISSTECVCDEWFEIAILKKKGTSTIEAILNDLEHLHVVVDENVAPQTSNTLKNTTNEIIRKNTREIELVETDSKVLSLCDDEFFIGGLPETLKWKLSDDIGSFTGLIASLRINGVLQDLLEFSIERQRNNVIQISSRAASISGSYRETAWGKSGHLNLTCLHARSVRSPQSAYWLYLDTGIESAFKDKVRSIEDGRVLRLVATADNNLRGFYTCRARVARHVRNIATYGVIGQALKYSHSLDSTTLFAMFTSGILVIATLAWLIFEAFYDLQHGYGFFRDLHISPEEEAEAICKFIDLNSNEIGSKRAIKLAKIRARSLALTRRPESEQSSTTQFELKNKPSDNFTENLSAGSGSYEHGLLPNIKEAIDNQARVYRSEPKYISSPRHGSHISSKPKLNFGFSCSLTSPCTEKSSMKENSTLKKYKAIFGGTNTEAIAKNTTFQVANVKSSKNLAPSPGQNILEKFRQLYDED